MPLSRTEGLLFYFLSTNRNPSRDVPTCCSDGRPLDRGQELAQLPWLHRDQLFCSPWRFFVTDDRGTGASWLDVE